MVERLWAEDGVEEAVGEGEAGKSMVERLLSEAGAEEGVGEKEAINSVVESADLVLLQQSFGVYWLFGVKQALK